MATVCPISRERFIAKAKSIEVEIFDRKILIEKKCFGTGAYGYFFQSKIPVIIDGVEVIISLQIQAPLMGSKETKMDCRGRRGADRRGRSSKASFGPKISDDEKKPENP